MDKVIKLQYKIIVTDIAILLVLMLLSVFTTKNPMTWIMGYAFGGIMGILNFILLGRTVYKASMMSPNKAQAYASVNYFFRMIITGLVLIIGLKADYLSGIAVIIGLLLIKQIIFFTQIQGSKSFFKKIIKRKEDK